MGTAEFLKAIAAAGGLERIAMIEEREKTWARFVAAERTYWQAVAKPYPANRFRADTHHSRVERLRLNRDQIAKELGVE